MKHPLFGLPSGSTAVAPIRHKFRPILASLLLASLAFGYCLTRDFASDVSNLLGLDWRGLSSGPLVTPVTTNCPQAEVLIPTAHRARWDSLGATYTTDEFKTRAVDWLGGAVRVPTECYDDFGLVSEDDRWDVFIPFHEFLLKAYPQVHATLRLTKVNTHGLLYLWPGSNDSLKPILLTAHQDVVPVNPSTVHEWKHPPFSGHFDGDRIWGRGSSDDKNGLIGILSSIESLIETGFQPTRTVVLAFGFDEEATGRMGAGELAKVLLDMYGKDGIAVLVDEGGGFGEQYGSTLAWLGVAESGYLDLGVEVTAAGGHSSVPPKHTSIGILSALFVEYEANPFQGHLTREDPLYNTLQCVAEHAKDVPSYFRKIIKQASHSKKALHALEKELFKEPMFKSLVVTTRAVDMIQGGVKANALPERATGIVNHRISAFSSVNETNAANTRLLEPLARKFNLTFDAFGEWVSEPGAPSSGTLALSDPYGTALEPAPITPTDKDAVPYRLISGTIKATYNHHRSLQGDNNIVISPTMPPGNTDTRYYWDLTRHIYRYNHGGPGKTKDIPPAIHTVNESIDVDAFLEMIRFFTTLILNADEMSDP